MIDNKRIARNTILLYFRLFILVIIQLYTVPILLKALGVEDYGLYNVIGSIMALMAIVGFLTSGCQRFFSFAIGENKQEKLKELFVSTRTICGVLSIVAFVCLEFGGIWFVSNKMIIPEGRYNAAVWVFELSAIEFCIGLFSIPYKAMIIAYEKMDYYAYVSISSSLLKLLAAFLLQFISCDLLIIYTFFIFLIDILERMTDLFYCYIHFIETRTLQFRMNIKMSTELLKYSGYNTIGGIAFTLRNQGFNVLINLFFGTILNAAHTIAAQVNGFVSQIINNLYQASRPQITKSFACGDLDGMWKLAIRTSLLAFYLVMTISIILIFELPTILRIWLPEVPKYTVGIARVMLMCLMLETIINQLIGVLQAMNKIKACQLTSCVIMLLNLPLAYLILKYDSSEIMYPYYVQLILSAIYVVSVVIVTNRVANLRIHDFLKYIFIRELVITLFAIIPASLLTYYMDPSLCRTFLVAGCTVVLTFIAILFYGFEKPDLIRLRTIMRTRLDSILPNETSNNNR